MTDEPDDEATDEDWYGDADPRVPDAATSWSNRDIGRDIGTDAGEDGAARAEMPLRIPSDYRESAAELRELERRLEQQRTPAFPIDIRKHLPLEAVWRRWRQLAMWGRSDVVDDFGRDPRATARWEWLFEFLYSKWFRVQATGLENIPARGRALLVANHAGTLPYDSAMVMHAVRRDHPARRDVRPLVEDTVFHLPFLGPIMNRIGGVRADPANAERLLESDELVAVFPEGEKGMGKLWKDRYHETTVHWALVRAGETLYLSSEFAVDQMRDDLSISRLLGERLGWGRLFAYTRARETGMGKRLVLAALAPVLPLLLFARLARHQVTKRQTLGKFIAASPLVALLLAGWSLGEMAGYLTGKP